jgi:hypothetical protein
MPALQLGGNQGTQITPTSSTPNQSANPLSFLGLGSQYQFNPYQINTQAYQNPVGNVAPAWQAAMGQYLGANTSAAPTVAQTNLSQVNPAYNGQMAVAEQYQNLANGRGPSMAAVQAQQQGQQNLQAALAAQGAARGGNPATAAYNTQAQLGAINQQTAQNAVLGRTQEELGALQGAGSAYGAAAGTGLNSAQLQQAQSLGQAGITQNQQQLNTGAWNNYLQQLYGQNSQQFAANQNLQQLQANQNLQYQQLAAGQLATQNSNNAKLGSGAMQLAGSFFGL